MVNEEIIINDRKERANMINRIEVLEKVKGLLLLGDSEFATTLQVADYYEVDLSVIQKLVSRNKEELESNGMKLYYKNEIKNLIGQDVKLQIIIPNRGMKLFSKRAILNVGILLRDSIIAKEVRRRLLDIEYESNKSIQENGQLKISANNLDNTFTDIIEGSETNFSTLFDVISFNPRYLFETFKYINFEDSVTFNFKNAISPMVISKDFSLDNFELILPVRIQK